MRQRPDSWLRKFSDHGRAALLMCLIGGVLVIVVTAGGKQLLPTFRERVLYMVLGFVLLIGSQLLAAWEDHRRNRAGKRH